MVAFYFHKPARTRGFYGMPQQGRQAGTLPEELTNHLCLGVALSHPTQIGCLYAGPARKTGKKNCSRDGFPGLSSCKAAS